MESMTDILSDKEPEKTEVAPETPEPEAPVEHTSRRKEHLAKELTAQGRDPATGQFIPKEAPKEEAPKVETPKETAPAPKQELTEKERGFLKAAEEERRKRQELERRLEALEKSKKEPEEKKTFWDDPEGHFKKHEENLANREKQLILSVSEKIARSKYTDFDDNIQVFAEILQTPAGPGVHAQFISAADPAEFAYRLGKQTKELREAGSVEALRERIAKEERQKLEAEYKKKQEDLEKQRKELTPSLSEVKGAAKQQTPVWTGPTSFADILK